MNTLSSKTTETNSAYYIKLGRRGEWEKECLRDGTLRFGYRQTPHELCVSGRWDKVRQIWLEIRGDSGQATRDANQIRIFYEATEQDIFITFAGGLMHWCRPASGIEVLDDGSKRRKTLDGWRTDSLGGTRLATDRLSGSLVKTQAYRGTICAVTEQDYLFRKLRDELSPTALQADSAEASLVASIKAMMKLLSWKDFELLVDLVFSGSGWKRLGTLGSTQKSVDLELILPSTGERAFVQVKSKASGNAWRRFAEDFQQSTIYDRAFFAWHTGTLATEEQDGITLLTPERLARMVMDAGLWTWLRNKVS